MLQFVYRFCSNGWVPKLSHNFVWHYNVVIVLRYRNISITIIVLKLDLTIVKVVPYYIIA